MAHHAFKKCKIVADGSLTGLDRDFDDQVHTELAGARRAFRAPNQYPTGAVIDLRDGGFESAPEPGDAALDDTVNHLAIQKFCDGGGGTKRNLSRFMNSRSLLPGRWPIACKSCGKTDP